MALLGLMGVKAQLERGGDPQRLSFARTLRAVRTMTRQPHRRCGRHRLTRMLAKAIKDNYHRRSAKKARGWPHKKKDPPTGTPRITDASEPQKQLAQSLRHRNQIV